MESSSASPFPVVASGLVGTTREMNYMERAHAWLHSQKGKREREGENSFSFVTLCPLSWKGDPGTGLWLGAYGLAPCPQPTLSFRADGSRSGFCLLLGFSSWERIWLIQANFSLGKGQRESSQKQRPLKGVPLSPISISPTIPSSVEAGPEPSGWMNEGLRVWVEQCTILVYGIRSLENWRGLGLRERERGLWFLRQQGRPGGDSWPSDPHLELTRALGKSGPCFLIGRRGTQCSVTSKPQEDNQGEQRQKPGKALGRGPGLDVLPAWGEALNCTEALSPPPRPPTLHLPWVLDTSRGALGRPLLRPRGHLSPWPPGFSAWPLLSTCSQ